MLDDPWMFVIAALASFRLARFFVRDSLVGANTESGSKFSQLLDNWAWTEEGAPKGWVRDKVGNLLVCTYCLGFWLSLAVWCGLTRTWPWDLTVEGWATVFAVAGAQALLSIIDIQIERISP